MGSGGWVGEVGLAEGEGTGSWGVRGILGGSMGA